MGERVAQRARLWHCQRGQMSVFVALIFQILFVFFAMAINVGLLIHDKINLQNSVDLAAYYGAKKMAEMMNAMAHINYQIRQDYKLLAFRTRVIGGMGYDHHPFKVGPASESRFNGQSALVAPSCIAWLAWEETTDEGQNICRATNHRIRELPRLPVIAGFIPINVVVSQFVDQVRNLITSTCEGQRDLNWNYSASSLYFYRTIMSKRKEAFKALALNLSREPENMLDMDALSIQEGVRRTLENNLTAANFDGGLRIEYLNGLGDEALTGLPAWLSEILITPQLFYIFFDSPAVGGCSNQVRPLNDMADVRTDPNLRRSAEGEPTTEDLHSSLGFEKNPWRMAYFGVKATTRPRKPFAPFGEPVQLVARAFAKPFGGRMGPWHKASWPRGSGSSGDGLPEVDQLVVPRVASPGALSGFSSQQQLSRYVPNFSKYPGDQLGLKSNLALRLYTGYNPPGRADAFGLARDFAHISQVASDNADPLSFNPGQAGNAAFPGGVARTMELAAVAPDLFDITYYSIESNFHRNYGDRAIWQSLGVPVPRDMGSLPNGQNLEVMTQVEHANSSGRRNSGGLHFYKVTNPSHLLTSWHQKGESDYELDEARFGRCNYPVPINNSAAPTPGQCLVGGRSGYSVKLISKSYLDFSGHAIGGDGTSAGALLNPPPGDF